MDVKYISINIKYIYTINQYKKVTIQSVIIMDSRVIVFLFRFHEFLILEQFNFIFKKQHHKIYC